MEGTPTTPSTGPEGPQPPAGPGSTPSPEGPQQGGWGVSSVRDIGGAMQPQQGPDNWDPQAMADRTRAAEAARGSIASSGAFAERPTNEPVSEIFDKPTTEAERAAQASDSAFLAALRENMARHERTMKALDTVLRGEQPVNQISPEQRVQTETKFAAAYDEWVKNLFPEDREALERSAREAIKGALGITDTADMNEETRRAHEATVDWFFGKLRADAKKDQGNK